MKKFIFESKTNIKKFRKDNKTIFNIFILSMLIAILYIFISGYIPKLPSFIKEFINLIYQLSIAYIASLIFYIIVNYIPEKKKVERYRKVGFQQLSEPLKRHIRLFQYIYKSTLYKKPEQIYIYPYQMLDDNFFKSLENFDFTSEAPVTSGIPWITYISKEFELFLHELKEVLLKYSYFFEDKDIDLIENISGSDMMRFLTNRGNVRMNKDNVWYQLDNCIEQLEKFGNDNRTLFLPDQQGCHHFKKYISLILELIDVHDKIVKENKITIDSQLWSDSIAPKYRTQI